MIQIKDTDILFRDSHNVGDPDCKCSRCHRLIKEGESVARNFLNSSDLVAVNKETGEKENLGNNEGLRGLSLEYRLCTECNLKWLRKYTGQSFGMCVKAIEKCPDSFDDQIDFVKKHGKKF